MDFQIIRIWYSVYCIVKSFLIFFLNAVNAAIAKKHHWICKLNTSSKSVIGEILLLDLLFPSIQIILILISKKTDRELLYVYTPLGTLSIP